MPKRHDLRKRIGERVRALRLARKQTQAELAEAVGVDETSLRAIEAGRRGPSLELLDRLADELSVDPGALVSTAAPTADSGAEFAALLEGLPPKWREILLAHARHVAKAVRR